MEKKKLFIVRVENVYHSILENNKSYFLERRYHNNSGDVNKPKNT